MIDIQAFQDQLMPNYAEIDGAMFAVFSEEDGEYQVFPITDASRKMEVAPGQALTPIRNEKRRPDQKVIKATRGPKDCWTVVAE